MTNKKLALLGFLHALGTVAYIALVALIMNNGNRWFGPGNGIVAGVAILSLFVLSAAIVGSLVLGRPVLWYMDGKKSEGIKLFLCTLGWLLIFTLIIFAVLAALPKHTIIN